jgi:HK97 family phage prohead protease
MPRTADREYRAASSGFSADAAQPDGSRLLLRGKPIVYDTPTLLFEQEGQKIYEVIARGALAGADMSDFIFNCEHQGRVYARSRNGSLRLRETESGAEVEAELDRDDQGHRQLYNDIQAGRLDRMSFSFTIAADDFDEATGIYTVRSIKKLYDVSAVAFAAYDSTTISARSAFLLEEHQKRKAEERRQRARAIAYALTF